MANKETYSTRKAWGLDKNPQVIKNESHEYWRQMAEYFRRKNRKNERKVERLMRIIDILKKRILNKEKETK